MKLRLKGSSIRLRLTRREVEQLISAGVVEEIVEFGPTSRRFAYAVGITPGDDSVWAEYKDDRLSVSVPALQARRWSDSEEVGIEAHVNGLHVLVEKDFGCLKPRQGEDQSDMFPNPGAASC